jgi:hypothetical protein
MHPKVAEAIQQIDAAVLNGDTFENPDDRKEFLVYLESWCKVLSQPFHGTKPPVFEEEWAKKEADGYQYGRDALENVKFGFEIAQEAYERGYDREVETSASVITIALEIEGDVDAASQVVEHFLDEGTLQDAINEHEGGCRVKSAVSS